MIAPLRHMFVVFCALAFAGVQTACACAHEHIVPVAESMAMAEGHDHCADMVPLSGEPDDQEMHEGWKACDHGSSLKADITQVSPFAFPTPIFVVTPVAFGVEAPVVPRVQLASWPAAVDPPPQTPMQAKTRFLN